MARICRLPSILFALFPALVMLLIPASGSTGNSLAPSAEYFNNQRQSADAFNRILEYLNKPFSSYGGREDFAEHPPNYGSIYAGAYVNDKGRLVVLLADEIDVSSQETASEERILSPEITDMSFLSAKQREFACELIQAAGGDLIFQKARYCYTYLTDLVKWMNSELSANKDDPKSIWSEVTGFGIEDDKNCISVGLFEANDAKIENFKKEVSDSQAIVFKDDVWFSPL